MKIFLYFVFLHLFSYTHDLENFKEIFTENSNKIETQININNGKWWSSSLFGNVHKKICKKAFELIPKEEYPDLWYYKNEIIDGCKDEDGHKDPKDNGGDPKEIWFNSGYYTKPTGRVLAVLYHYNNLNWDEAYENIGSIVHLTQDQASPPHAANIAHSYFDGFERFYEADNNIKIRDIDIEIPSNLKPWEYYLFVQKNTRIKLKEWIDPESNIPYWEENENSLPLNQDNTLGPNGRYGGGKDHFLKIECENYDNSEYKCNYMPKSPEIRDRQLTLSIIATEKLLKSASKNLPPVIKINEKNNNFLDITIYENRCQNLIYYQNGYTKLIELGKEFPFSKRIKIQNSKKLTVFDCDGNRIDIY